MALAPAYHFAMQIINGSPEEFSSLVFFKWTIPGLFMAYF